MSFYTSSSRTTSSIEFKKIKKNTELNVSKWLWVTKKNRNDCLPQKCPLLLLKEFFLTFWISCILKGCHIFFLFCSINLFFCNLSAWGNLGNVLKSQGKMEEAEQAYRNALYYRSNMADMLYNLWVCIYSYICVIICIFLSLSPLISFSIRWYQSVSGRLCWFSEVCLHPWLLQWLRSVCGQIDEFSFYMRVSIDQSCDLRGSACCLVFSRVLSVWQGY